MENRKKITPEDFEAVWDEKLSEYVKDKIEKYNFEYEEFDNKERDEWIRFICEVLLHPLKVVKAGPHRVEEWQRGWKENADAFISSGDIKDISPNYFEKYPVIRWNEDFIKPKSENFEERSLAIIQDWLFDKHFRDVGVIYEFGCGTCHNLLRVRGVNKDAELIGLDWVKSPGDLVQKLKKEGIEKNISFELFDFFNPNQKLNLKEKSGIFTVAALEQVGEKFEPFLNYLLEKKPKICIHIEPIAELLNEDKLLDYLSVEYFRTREYLSGFLIKLKELEKKGKIKIHEAKRSYIGSLFIEGYSIIVWSPCDS